MVMVLVEVQDERLDIVAVIVGKGKLDM